MKRWSSLQRELYKLIDENINFQIHLSKYKMGTMGSTYIPRYWITLDKEIIFDYPKQFLYKDEDGFTYVKNLNGDKLFYPYSNDISDISDLIREYIDTPKDEVFTAHFDNDYWGLINILKAADKRFGKNRLELLRKRTDNKAAQKILQLRLN